MLALDTETTGVDLRHGARPFFVTLCDDQGNQTWYEWDVDPLTRAVEVPEADLAEIREVLERHRRWAKFDRETADRHVLVGQNIKFDCLALGSIGVSDFPWPAVRDTLLAAHLLTSNQPKDLTALAIRYLGVDIEPREKALKKACDEARRMCRSKFPEWRIAKAGLPEMPSAKETVWKFDTWLPRAVVKHLWETSEAGQFYESNGQDGEPEEVCVAAAEDRPGWEYRPPTIEGGDHPWWTVLSNYANADSAVTVALWPVMWREIERRNLGAIYRERLRVLPVVARMEADGVTVSKTRLRQLRAEFGEESERAGRVCVNLAAGMGAELVLPKAGSNESLMSFCFRECAVERLEKERAKAEEKERKAAERAASKSRAGLRAVAQPSLFDAGAMAEHGLKVARVAVDEDVGPCLDLPVLSRTDTGRPSLDKNTLDNYLASLSPRSKGYAFVNALRNKRKRDTALAYMDGYERFWVPLVGVDGVVVEGYYRLFPNLNPTGTDTLRFSSSNPNEQNISKQEGFSLRRGFGPAPGREWWSCDAKNIEARLPAYESGEQELISLYEQPDVPPYYGSQHLLNFHTVYPDLWERELQEVGLEKVGPHCKKKYASTWYQWVKNGGFAVQYGAMDRDGGGGTADRAFHKRGAHALLKQRFSRLESLNQHWIRFADRQGYVETMPDRSVDPKRGYPLLVTRSEWGKVLPTVPLNYHIQGTACWWMVRAMVRCQEQLDAWQEEDGFDGRIAMQVHDELVFDFPRSEVHPSESEDRSNLWRIRVLQELMEVGGRDLVVSGRPSGIPTPTGVEYHEENWAEGVTL